MNAGVRVMNRFEGRSWTRLRVWSGLVLAGIGTVVASPCVPRLFPATFLMVLGAAWRIWAAGYIHKDRVLTLAGPYAGHRHPLYFGTFLVGVGIALMVHTLWFWGLYVLYFLGVYGYTIKREEAALAKQFGAVYRDYQERIPLWWPLGWLNPIRPKPEEPQSWRWSQVHVNREIPTTLIILGWAGLFWVLWWIKGHPVCVS